MEFCVLYFDSSRDENRLTISGPGFSDSLLHSLSSGLWAQTQFRMAVSFSPFLPFWPSGKSRPQGWLFLFYKHAKYFPVHRAYKLVNRDCDCHFIPAAFQYLFITNKCCRVTRNINYAFHI